jgi:hypothetical protein
MAMATAQVYQFKLALIGGEPTVWRRIQVSETYSFWDLHVALRTRWAGSTIICTSFV